MLDFFFALIGVKKKKKTFPQVLIYWENAQWLAWLQVPTSLQQAFAKLAD